MSDQRVFVPPFGWPMRLRVAKCRATERPKLLSLNRYPRQIIGLAIRLPRDGQPGHPYMSVLWARPSRWWR